MVWCFSTPGIFFAMFYKFHALVAQLAEHIHGKDKVISSILIEGWVLSVAQAQQKGDLQVSGASLV